MELRQGGGVDEFEIVVTLLSFVYALGLTHLLQFLSDLVIARRRVRLSFLHMFWTALALFLLVNNWLALAPLRESGIGGAMVLNQFGFAVVQYFCCSLVSFRVPDDGPVDLVAYEESHGRYYRIPFLVLGVLALVGNYISREDYFAGTTLQQFLVFQGRIVACVVLIALSIWRRERWLQIAAAGALTFLMFFPRL